MAERTTPALESATPVPGVKNPHLAWVETLAAGRELGVEIRALCGVWFQPWPAEREDVLENVGGIMPATKERDCPDCAAALLRLAGEAL